MPRRSSSRPAPRAAPRPSSRPDPVKNPPQPVNHAPPPALGQQSGSILGGLGSVVAEGMAFGTGSAIAHKAADAIFGPRTIQHEVVGSPAASPAAPVAATNNAISSNPCNIQSKAFQECIESYGSDISKCQFYLDMLNECRGMGKTLRA